MWLPQGLDDPSLALLHVPSGKAEYWAAPGNKVKRLYGLAKALTTGDKSAIGDNKKVDVKQPGQLLFGRPYDKSPLTSRSPRFCDITLQAGRPMHSCVGGQYAPPCTGTDL